MILTESPSLGEKAASESLAWAKKEKRGSSEGARHLLCLMGYAQHLQGKLNEAEQSFESARRIASDARRGTLTGLDAVLWALHLVDTGRRWKAGRAMKSALRMSQQGATFELAPDIRPIFLWMRARISIKGGRLARAVEDLDAAETALRKQRFLAALPFVLHAKAEVYERQGRWQESLDLCEKGLEQAGEMQLILIHIELLILRARVCLSRTADADAMRDAYEAMHAASDAATADAMAERHGYLCLRRETALVAAEAAEAQGDEDGANEYRFEALRAARLTERYRRSRVARILSWKSS